MQEYTRLFKGDGAERGYSARNSGEIESFVREPPYGVGDDEINHFVFCDCHFSFHYGYDLVRGHCKESICPKYWYFAAQIR